MGKKISIIVPVYNVEDYLAECIESIIKQTYADIEILLVDDGSKDGSLAICREYEQKDARIRVLTKINGGLSDARNFGMAHATGDYYMFLDSDDTITPDACEVLYELIDAGAEVAIGELYKQPDAVLRTDKAAKWYTPAEALKVILEETSFSTSACAKLFDKKVFEGILFPVGKLFEDLATVYKVLYQAEKIAFINYDVYYYRVRENSITTQAFNVRKMDLFEFTAQIREFVEANCPEALKAADNRRTRYAISFLKEIAYCKEREEACVKELLGYVKADIWSYLFSPYKLSSKLFGLVCVINYNMASAVLRKLRA